MSSLWKEFFLGTTESQVEEHRQKRIEELRNLSIDLLKEFGREDEEGHGLHCNLHSIFLSLPVERGGQETTVKIWTFLSDGLENPWIKIHIPLIQHNNREVNLNIDASERASFTYRKKEEGMISLFKILDTSPVEPSLNELMQYLSWIRPLHEDLIKETPGQLPE